MLSRIRRRFVITTRLEAFLVIYALAIGAAERGRIYLETYPGFGGRMLFLACLGTVAIAGAKILDCIRYDQQSSRLPVGPQTADMMHLKSSPFGGGGSRSCD